MRVVEIGCGTGLVSLWMAQVVGTRGSVTAMDVSHDQLRVAERNAAAAAVTNVAFQAASSYDTSLPEQSFDLVYSCFRMCPLTQPLKALTEMRRLLKSGGVLVCEDHDDGGILTEPPTRAYKRLVEISEAVNRAHGRDSYVGLKLPRLMRDA
jgi:ubiquinone/menaquinone biosynthesis C-methylase UbiE